MTHAVFGLVFPEIVQLKVYPILEGGRLLAIRDGFLEFFEEGLVFDQDAAYGLTAILVNLSFLPYLVHAVTKECFKLGYPLN